jgi:hypothetical protein
MAGAMRRKEADRQAAQPPRAIERTDKLPTPPTTHANPRGERSLAAQLRTSPSEAQAEAERNALGALLGIRRAPKGGLATGHPECNVRATRCETPLLERPRRLVHSAHAAGLWPAPSGQRTEESSSCQPSTGLVVLAASVALARCAVPPHDGCACRLDCRTRMQEVIDEPPMHPMDQTDDSSPVDVARRHSKNIKLPLDVQQWLWVAALLVDHSSQPTLADPKRKFECRYRAS